MIDFFKYFANSFDYTKSVISIRSERGTLGKEEKGWNSDVSFFVSGKRRARMSGC